MTTADQLDSRYGRTPGAARRTRWVVAASAVAFVIVFAAWLLWGGLLASPAQYEAKDVAHQAIGDTGMSVTWQFTSEPNTPARCAVQALNSTFGIVGWKVVDIAPSPERIREFTEVVRTSELAVTGLIYRCWLT